MEPVPVRIEEVKRICYWYKHAHSGTVLTTGLLGSLSTVQAFCGHDFHAYSKFNTQESYKKMLSVFSEIGKIIDVTEFEYWTQKEQYDIHLDRLEEYIKWLKHTRSDMKYTVKEMFIAYFLFQYNEHQKSKQVRITPILFYDPHVWDNSFYDSLVKSFPYKMVLTCVREPIMTFMRCYLIGIAGWSKFQDQYLLGSDYVHAQFLSKELREYYYGWKFEDLKMYPEKLLPAICEHLNVPFENIVLKQEVPMTDRYGHTVKGFDQSPLHYDLSSVLSDFDKLRLQIFYEPIHKYYRYDGFDSQEYPLEESDVRKMFSYPFRFERINLYKVSQEEFHERIQFVLQNFWKKQIVVPKLIQFDTKKE